MTAPQSYGAAPRLIEDTTFVPAKMFELMGYQFSIVGQFVNFTNKENVEMPNPFVSYESIDSAAKVLGYKPCIPSYIPDEYNLKNISVMNNRMLQLIYTDKNDNKLIYRTKKGNDDISGDYTIYPINKEVDVNNVSITLLNYSQVSRHKKAHFFRGAGYFVCSQYKASASFGVSILSVTCGLFVL